MNRLKLLRDEKQLSQEEVGKIIGKTGQAYGLYENGKRDIPTEILVKLSEYYNVSVDYILGNSDNKQPTKLDSNLLKIGLDMKNYNPPTEEQKKQIEDFAKFINLFYYPLTQI